MKLSRGMLVLTLAAGLGACSRAPSESASQRNHEANTAAGKVGQAAHTVAKDAGKVAKSAGRSLSKAAHEAREGWKEADRRDRSKETDRR
jgi:hypothetical protein